MASLKKKIPNSLEECYASDTVSNNLWTWSKWLSVWGVRFSVVLIIIGCISTVSAGLNMMDIDEDLVIITFVKSILTWGLYAFITYCSYKSLSLLVASLATIVLHAKITANVALYNTAKEERAGRKDNEKSTHKWLCGTCGKMRDTFPCPYCGNK